MQLLVPEILADACDLSLGLIILGLVLGVVLWLFGWWTHRFWVVMMTTVLAGIYGLYEAPVFRAHPLWAALLLAVTAGMLALAVVRVLAFAAGGLAGLLAIQALAPSFNQPMIGFLACGLVGIFLFRLWMMALTSFVGTLLMAYSGLSILSRSGSVDVVTWTEQFGPPGDILLNWACVLIAGLGLLTQFLLDQGLMRRQTKKERKSPRSSGHKEVFLPIPLWGWGFKFQRRAG